jgi:FHA domain
MADRSDVMRRPPRVPLRPRSRRRWAVAAGIGCVWALLLAGTGSLVVGTALLMLVAAIAIVCAVALRSLGIDSDHPWARVMATRPWRDGRDVLRLGLRHVAEVFIVTPTGSLLAPNAVELLMNPDDLAALTETMDLEVINLSATELYQAQITARAARLASIGPVAASVIGDPAVPAGRYRLRQSRPPSPAPPDGYLGPRGGHPAPPDAYPVPQDAYAVPQDHHLAPTGGSRGGYLAPPNGHPAYPNGHPAYPNGKVFPYAHDGRTTSEPDVARTILTGQLTVTEAAPAPLLRLVTGGSIAETRVSGARAGRGDAVELALPDEPTVSRVHAEFTFTDGQWWITGLGRNGVTLNGMPLNGEHVLGDGDFIQWGQRSDAMVSRVQIG